MTASSAVAPRSRTGPDRSWSRSSPAAPLAPAAAPAVLALPADRRWLLYADAMYRRLPGLTATRLARMERAGLAPQRATLASTPDDQRRKRAGVHCYRSQLRAL